MPEDYRIFGRIRVFSFDLFILFQLASHHWKYLISSFRIERQVLDGWIQVSSSALALFLFFFFFKTLIDSWLLKQYTIKDDVIHKSWYQNILTCTMQYQQTVNVNKLEGFFKLHKHKYEKRSLMTVALITVVFLLLAPGAANCGGGRGWGAGADHNSRPVPAVIGGGSLRRVDNAPRYHKALVLSQCSVSDSVINWAGLTGRGQCLGHDWWRLHHASLTSGPGHNSSSTLNRAKFISNRTHNIKIGK